jgi:hypothetical protein
MPFQRLGPSTALLLLQVCRQAGAQGAWVCAADVQVRKEQLLCLPVTFAYRTLLYHMLFLLSAV